jgi:hypothetical protein
MDRACRLLVVTPEGTMPPGIPRHRWVDNVKMNLEDIQWTGLNWLRLITSGGHM